MASSVFLLFAILFLLSSSSRLVESDNHGYISGEISSKGLDFLKDSLVSKAESALVPLQLPDIEKTVHIPLLGNVDISLSGIVINTINLTSSAVAIGDIGIVVDVSGATAGLSMSWKYSYRAKLLPISVSDKGNASVQVEEMDIGLTVGLKTVEGSLVMSLLDSGCYVKDLSVKLNGGASWLYQGLVGAFSGKIESGVEDAISSKLNDSVVKIDSLFESLPKEVRVTEDAALNVTFVGDPKLSESSVDVGIDGLFSAPDHGTAVFAGRGMSSSVRRSCEGADKMIKLSVHENVLESAASVYFEAGKMRWDVENVPVPDRRFLNTTWWRFVFPKLYKTYPNRTMVLNVSVSSPPEIRVRSQQITAEVHADVVINVLEGGAAIPAIGVSGAAEMTGNSVSGSCKLIDFDLSLNWSNIGDLHLNIGIGDDEDRRIPVRELETLRRI
ncbi:hypothetical protein M569_15154 [Genlisea aurea]|uniref:Lipid-binding serum glycoprotein N-terminal domain-containing protein n=1 Tax=Genlisea aurea TaxID=192259 RepID=S8C5D2_9LAMI|nr:hypothetical protein M569_15154 [Genlisea aurea]